MNNFYPHPSFQSKKKDNNNIKSVSTKGKIILGYPRRTDTTNPVYIPYDGKHPISVLCAGGKRGYGKTVATFNVADSLINDFNFSAVFIDPKGECYPHRKPSPNKSYFRERGLKPKGLKNLIKIIPTLDDCLKVVNLDVNDVDEKKVWLQMFNTNELTHRDLETMMGNIKTSSSAISKLIKIAGEYKTEMYPNQTIADVIKIANLKLPEVEEMKERINKKSAGIKNDVLLREFNNLLEHNAIGRIESYPLKTDPETGQNIYTHSPDIISLLNANKPIDYITGLEAKDNPTISAYVAIIMRKIRDARIAYLESLKRKNKDNIMDNNNVPMLLKKLFFYMEEFDTLFPKVGNPSCKELIMQSYNQWRYLGISMIGIAPDFKTIHPSAIKQSSYLIVAKILDNEEMKTVIKARELDERNIHNLMTLAVDETKQPVAEFLLVHPNGHTEKFYPKLPCSAIAEEQRTAMSS